MRRLEIDRDRCKACELCIEACNRNLLALDEGLNAKGYHPIAIHDEQECTSCTLCGVVCPDGCFTVWKEQKAEKSR